MPTMELSSIRRLRTFVVGEQSEELSTSVDNDRLLRMWLSSVSGMIEQWLDRSLLSQQYTEYFNLTPGRTRFWVKGLPITTLTSVYEDSSGEWDGSQSELTEVFTDEYGGSANIPFTLGYTGVKAIRVIYTGGLALHPVNSVYAVTTSDSFTTGKWIIGNTSGARALVVSEASGSLTLEDYYGQLIVGETLTEYDEEEGTNATGSTAVLDSVTSASLLRGYPDIVMGAETQIRFMWKHSTDFENDGTNRDGATLRRANMRSMPLPLQRETLELIQAYKRRVF